MDFYPYTPSPITLDDLIGWSGAVSAIETERRGTHIHWVWMDSRKIGPGDVFVALKSDTDDGHNYVSQTLQAGASAAIVDTDHRSRYSPEEQRKLIVVDDCLKALHDMALGHRKRLTMPIVAITGSNGKTTTRLFVTRLLEALGTVGCPQGNWNNHIGVPLTILRLQGTEKVVVLEMGANHEHEIETLTRIILPDVGIITNIGYAHIGYFKTLSTTTRVKFEIARGIDPRYGLLLLNGDDRRLVEHGEKCGVPVQFFGSKAQCAIRASDIAVGDGTTSFTVDGYRYALPMPGRHFIYCALPGLFLARTYGIPQARCADALSGLAPDPMRGSVVKKKGITFIVDCYNANPSSMRAGIQLLKDVGAGHRICAVVGDMRELGSHAKRLHRALGMQLAQAGVAAVIAVGNQNDAIAAGAAAAGMPHNRIFCAGTAHEAVPIGRSSLQEGDTVLLKASRAVKLEDFFEAF